MSPQLTTPAWTNATDRPPSFDFGADGTLPEDGLPGSMQRPISANSVSGLGNFPGGNALGGLSQVDQWAWEIGSEAGSIPSVWSRASTQNSNRSGATSHSRISNAAGDGLIPGLIEGQRLSYVKPTMVPTSGGKVVVVLRKQVPQGFWDHIGIVLVQNPQQVKLRPTSIKKGKKLYLEVPGGLAVGDYDVRLSFAGKMIHGSLLLAVCDTEDEENPAFALEEEEAGED